MESNTLNVGMYIIDKDYKIVNVNRAMNNMYPEVKVGDVCYKALAFQDSPCSTCPLFNKDIMFFNPVRKEWIKANAAEIDYPGHGECYNVQFTMHKSVSITNNERIRPDKIDKHIAMMPSFTGDGCVFGTYCEPGSPIFFANERLVTLLGYDNADEMMEAVDGMGVNMMHPDDRKRVKKDIEGFAEVGKTFETAYRTRKKDGTWFWIILNGKTILTKENRLALICECSDMTDFLNKHAALQKEKDELTHKDELNEVLTKQIPGCYHRCSNEEGYPFLYVSKSFEEAVGWTWEEIKEQFDNKFINLIYPGDMRLFEGLVDQIDNAGQGSTIYRLKKKGGGYIWVQDSTMYIDTGDVAESFFQCTLADITKFVEALEVTDASTDMRDKMLAIASKDQILSEITQMLYSYNITLNMNTKKYSLIEGTGLEDYVAYFRSTDDFEKAYAFNLDCIEPEYKQAFEQLSSFENLTKLEGKNGFIGNLQYAAKLGDNVTWQETNLFIGKNEYGEDIVNILGRDMTEYHERVTTRNQLAIAQASNEAKTRFLSNMSHDIRTPINAIMGMLHIAQTYRNDAKKVDDCLKKIETSTNYLLTLLNDILDINKLESGKTVVENIPFNMNDLIDDIYNIIQPSAVMTGIQLKKVYDKFKHPYVIGSTLHLRQILMNLVSNSIKYSKVNGIAYMKVEEQSFEDDTVWYKFVVQDNGIGMSKEFQQKMFDIFEQEYSGARTQHKGSGLGLAIVKMLVDLLGGELLVESEKDKGSTFTVLLPFAIDRNPSRDDRIVSVETVENLNGIRILLVEDNDFNMEIAQFILSEAGAVITPAENGKKAVDLFEKNPQGTFDVILMDIMMPEMDGLEAAKIIRGLSRQDAPTIPIVAMTANAFEDDVKKSLEAGMNAHVAKPLDISTLISAIAKSVKNMHNQ